MSPAEGRMEPARADEEAMEGEVDVIAPFSWAHENVDLSENEACDVECSSSFGSSLASDDSDVALTSREEDTEGESSFREWVDSDAENVHPEPGGRARKSLNLEWKLYRKGIEWRARWIELRMKFLHRQAKRYDRLLLRLQKSKRIELLSNSHISVSASPPENHYQGVNFPTDSSIDNVLSKSKPQVTQDLSASQTVIPTKQLNQASTNVDDASLESKVLASGALMSNEQEKTAEKINQETNEGEKSDSLDNKDRDLLQKVQQWSETPHLKPENSSVQHDKELVILEKNKSMDEYIEKEEIKKDLALEIPKSMGPTLSVHDLHSDDNPIFPPLPLQTKAQSPTVGSMPIDSGNEKQAKALPLMNERMNSARTRSIKLIRRKKRRYMLRRQRKKDEFDDMSVHQLARHPLFSRYTAVKGNRDDLDEDDHHVTLPLRYTEDFYLYPPDQMEDSFEYLLGRVDELSMRVENLKYQLCKGQSRKSQTRMSLQSNQRQPWSPNALLPEPLSPEPNMEVPFPDSNHALPERFDTTSDYNFSPKSKLKAHSFVPSDRFGSPNEVSNPARTSSEDYDHNSADIMNTEVSFSRNSFINALPPSLSVNSSMQHRKKAALSSYDIDNMVMSVNVGTKYVEQVRHEYIDIPQWRDAGVQDFDFGIEDVESSEDTDDEAYIRRHSNMEMKEKMIFHGIQHSDDVKENQRLPNAETSRVVYRTHTTPPKHPSNFPSFPQRKRLRRTKARDMSDWCVPLVVSEKPPPAHVLTHRDKPLIVPIGEVSRSTPFIKVKHSKEMVSSSSSRMIYGIKTMGGPGYHTSKPSHTIGNPLPNPMQPRVQGRGHAPHDDPKGKKAL